MRRQELPEKTLQSRRPAPGDKKASGLIEQAYYLLLVAFGPQGWWPVLRPAASGRGAEPGRQGGLRRTILRPVYCRGRYNPPSAAAMFEICAGAILTQNTSWKNAEKALCALARARILSPHKMKACPASRLEALIRSSGYYRQKAGRLKIFCSHILRAHPEGLRKWFSEAPLPSLRAELLSIRGIGPETADSILLYAAGKPCFVADAYARRIARRLGLCAELSYERLQEIFQAELSPDVKMYNEYHALLVKLGKDFCRKTLPGCAGCPLRRICRAKHGYDRTA